MHVLDAAHLFRLSVEQAPAGSRLHAVGDEGVPIHDIAGVIGRHLNLPVAAIAAEDAAGHFTWLASFIALDSPAGRTVRRSATSTTGPMPDCWRSSTRPRLPSGCRPV